MRRIFKKGLSVFLSLLMVMSSFAMLTPDMFMETEALTANGGSYYVRVYMRAYDGSDLGWPNSGFPNDYAVDSSTGLPGGDDINMAGFTLFYKDKNGTASTTGYKTQDIAPDLETFENKISDIRTATWNDTNTANYKSFTYSFSSIGFPTKLAWFLDEDNAMASTSMAIVKITVAASSTATEHILWQGLSGSESTREIKKGEITMESGAKTAATTEYDRAVNAPGYSSWALPKATTVVWSNTPEDMQCPEVKEPDAEGGTVSQSVQISSAKDQYGVDLYYPTWSVKGSSCGTTGISVGTTGAATGTTIYLTNAANVAGTTHTQTGTVTATWGSSSNSKIFTITDSYYTAKFNYQTQNDDMVTSTTVTEEREGYHGDTITPPTVPSYYEGDNYRVFSEWLHSYSSTITANVEYTASYNDTFISADYTAVDEAIAAVNKLKAELGAEYDSKYTYASRAALESAINAVDRNKGRSEQEAVDGYAQAINEALAALEVNKFAVIFLDKNGAIIKYEKESEYKSSITPPEFPEDQKIYFDADKHYTYTGWDSNEYTSVVDDLVIAPVYTEEAHDWETETVTSTCVQSGTTKYTCKVCGYVKYDGGDQYGDHVWEDDYTVDLEPNCVLEGSKSIHCSLCDERKDVTVIPAKGHTWSDFAVAVNPTCETIGISTRVCAEEDCKFCEHLIVDPLEHDYVKTTVPATCTAKGYDEYVCQTEGCGHSYRDNYTETTAPHTYGAWETISEARCGISGVKKQTCEDCGFVNLGSIDAIAHDSLDELEWSVIVDPTCEGKGYQTKTCSKCNQVIASEEINANGHDNDEVYTPADCTNGAYTTYTCKVCGHTEVEAVEGSTPAGHKFVETTSITPTCTTAGEKTVTCINGCGASTTVAIDKLPHTWSDWTVTPSTNTAKGSVSRECEKCGEIETVEIPEGNHNMVKDEAASTAPTCKAEGVTVYKCEDENCDVVLTLTETKLQHKVATEEIPATCTKEGSIRTYCSECGEDLADTVTIKKLAHVYVAGTAVAPNCTTSGYTPYTCECGDTYNKYDETKPATGHTYTGTETTITNATCTTDGKKTVQCKDCEKTIELVIPKLGHNYVLDATASSDATCKAEGKQVYKCDNCGDTHEVVLTKLSHDWGEWDEVKASTNTEKGQLKRICKECGEAETVDIPAGGHSFEYNVMPDPECEKAGKGIFVCNAHDDCGVAFTITLPALGHDKKVAYTAATCTTPGSVVVTCDRCNDELESTTIPVLSHVWGEGEITKATCQAKGKIVYTCTECTATREDEIPVDADAHSLVTTVTDATCTADGSVVTICANGCDYNETETIKAKGHTITTTVNNPQCGVKGSVVEECENCDYERTTDIPALNHSYSGTPEEVKAPTCTEDGINKVPCINDGCTSTTEVVVPKLGHSYDAGQKHEADCTGGEYTIYNCTLCDHTKIEYVEGSTPADHIFEEVIIRDATCTAEGLKKLVCKGGCGAVTEVVIPKLAHTWSDWTVTPSTNTAKGSVSRVCEKCGETETVEIPEGNHNMVKDEAASTAPTCKAEGVTVYKCEDENCDVVLTLTETKLQHTVTTEEIPATCTKEGSIRTYCSECGEDLADTVTIKKLAHVYVAGTAVAPTCTTSGYTPYTCECGDTYNKYDATKPATGHDYEEVADSSTADCTTAGTMTLKCADCGDEITADVPALGHDYVAGATTDATCDAEATQTYDCSRCEASYTIATSDKLTTHSYPDTWTTVKEATLTSIGYKTRACTVCGQIEVAEIPAIGDHEFTVLKETVNATCTEAGKKVYGCATHEDCGLESEVEIPKLGHDETLVYVAATCTDEGSVKRHCNRCNVDLETETIAALGHAWGNEVVTPATCQTKGKIAYTCTRTDCGATHEVEIPVDADAHSLVTTVTDATCTADGSVVTKCTNAGCDYNETETIKAKGHTITTVVTNPQCGVEGTVIEICSDCNYSKVTTIPALNHSYTGTPEEVKAPNCTEDGINKVPCVNNGCTSTTEVVVPKLGHSYDAGQRFEADCTNGAYTKYTCTRTDCGYVHVELDGTTGSGHDFSGTETIIEEATCTTDGEKEVKCKDCDVTTTVVIPKKGHAMGDWVQTKAPTCTEDGEQQKTCTNNCGEKIVAPVSKLGHNWGIWTVEKASTNTEKGQLKRTCERGCTETVEIPEGGHVLSYRVITAPTCEATGKAEFVCTAHTDCGVTAELVLDKTQHIVTTTVKDATCEEEGYIRTYCSACNEEFSNEPTQAIAHVYVAGTAVAPTCTSSGYTPYTCECGDTYNEYDATKPATKHNYEEVAGSSTADCTTAGTMTLKCKDCGDEITADVPALGHDYVAGATTDATCDAEATQTYKCSRCEASYTIATSDKLTTHSYPDTWTTVKAATFTSIGYKTRACTVCGQIEVAEIPATGDHAFTVLKETVNATCTADGKKVYGCETHADCGLESEVEIPKLGHDEKLVYTPASCTDEGSVKRVCNRCSAELESKTIEALGHIWGNEVVVKSTCADKGSIVYTCTRDCAATHTVDLAIDATAHSYKTTVTDATCTSTGSVVVTCIYCGDSETTTLAQKGHIWKDAPTSSIPATCTADGKEIYECENCDATHEVVLAKLGHNWSDWTVIQPTAITDGLVSRKCSRGCEESVVVPKGNHNMIEVAREDATCTEAGKIVYRCEDNCGIELTVTLDKLPHALNTTVLAPTCSKDGYIKETCAFDCGYVKTTVTPATGEHTLGDWTVVQDATCADDGILKRECTKCFGADEFDTIPATGVHTYRGNWQTVYEPTCESSGVEKDVCTVCSTVSITRQTDPTGHKLVTSTTAATCEVDGLSVTTCENGCSYRVETAVPKIGHDYAKTGSTNADCTTAPTETWTCKNDETHTYTLITGVPNGHSYDAGTVVKQATCTEPEITLYVCSGCDDSYERITAVPNGHSYIDNWQVITEVTATTNGQMVRYCTVCNLAPEYATVPATGAHVFVKGEYVAPDCETEGSQAWVCTTHTNCDANYTETIPAAGHKLILDTEDATCTATGYVKLVCSVDTCGEEVDSYEIPMLSHSYTEVEGSRQDSNCTELGSYKIACSCGVEQTIAIPAKGHSHTTDNFAATCTHGAKTVYTCDCGDTYTITTSDPLGHDWGEWTETKEATETEAGELTRECKNGCGATETAPLAPTGEHVFVKDTDASDDATCTTGGTLVFKCTAEHDCGVTYTHNVEAKGHQLKLDYKQSTCTEDGYANVYCTACGETIESNVIDMLGHNYKAEVTTDAKCGEAGEVTYTCENCRDSYIETVDALEHNFIVEVAGTKVAPTCITDGKVTMKCFNCDATEEKVLSKTGHLFDEGTVLVKPDCVTAGKIEYTCQYDHTHKFTETIEPTGSHTLVGEIVEYEATCTRAARNEQYCEACGNWVVVWESTVAPNHKWNSWVVEKQPTATEDGYQYRVCSVCGEIEEMTLTAGRMIRVIFYNENGERLTMPTYYTYGSKAERPETPVKHETDMYTFEFIGWTYGDFDYENLDAEIAETEEMLDYLGLGFDYSKQPGDEGYEIQEGYAKELNCKAVYREIEKEYKVTYIDGNGNTKVVENVRYSDIYDVYGGVPAKDSTEVYSYIFKEWQILCSKDKLTGEYVATATAQYTEIVNPGMEDKVEKEPSKLMNFLNSIINFFKNLLAKLGIKL